MSKNNKVQTAYKNKKVAIYRKNHSIKNMTQIAIFTSLIFMMAFIPFLGYIPLGFTKATLIHIPVIIGSLLLGPIKGAILGFMFGLTSLLNNTINPTAVSFCFSPFYSFGPYSGNFYSLIICFVPRILVGIVPYYIYNLFKKFSKKDVSSLGLIVSGVCASMVNTILVMNFIYLFFKDMYGQANGVSSDTLYYFILTIIGTNGVPEAIIAGFVVWSVGKIFMQSRLKETMGL